MFLAPVNQNGHRQMSHLKVDPRQTARVAIISCREVAAVASEGSPPEAEKLITSRFPAELLLLSGLIQTNPPQ